MPRMIARLRHSGYVLLLFLSFDVSAQSILLNSQFNTNLDNWDLGGLVEPVWDSLDADDNPGSGSALIRNTWPDGFSDEAVLSQCLFDGKGSYDNSVSVYIPSGQARTGSVVIRYYYYALSNDCTGDFQASGGALKATPFDQWVHLAGLRINALISPGGSIQYVIAIRKTEAGGEFKAWVDKAYLLREVPFKDSFEN
jgi:hypothetical protein